MPVGTPTPEIVARSMGEAPPGPPSREQALANQLKEAYRKKRDEDPLKALEPEATRQPLSINIDGEINRRIDRIPALAARALTEAALIQKVAEGRLIAGPERNALVTGLTARVIDRYPAFRTLPADQKASIIDELIDNPRYQETAQRLLTERLNPDEVVEDVRLSEVTIEFSRLQDALDQRIDSQVPATKGLDKAPAQTKLDEFQESVGGAGGTKGDQIKSLETSEQAQRRTIVNHQKSLDRSLNAGRTTEVQIEQFEQNVRTNIAAGTPPANAEEQAWVAYIRAKDNMQILDELRTEKSSYENRIKEIDDIGNLTNRLNAAVIRYDVVKQRQEEAVVAKLETVLRDAADEILKAEMREKALLQQALDVENQAKAKTDDEKNLSAEEKRQWEKPKRKGGKETSEIDKSRVKEEFGKMIIHGPDQQITAYLLSEMDRRMAAKGVAPLTPEYLAEVDRIQKLAADKEFMDKVRPQFVKGLTTRYLLKGGKVSKDEIRALRETEWGKGAVMSAIEDNKELMEEIRKTYGEGALGGYWEKLKHMNDGGFLKMLLLLLGTATLVIPGAMALKASNPLAEAY